MIDFQWVMLEKLGHLCSKARCTFAHLIQVESLVEAITKSLDQPPISPPTPPPQDPSLAIVSPARPTGTKQLPSKFSLTEILTMLFQGLNLPPPPSTAMSSTSQAPTKRVHGQLIIEERNQPQKRSRLHEVGHGLVVICYVLPFTLARLYSHVGHLFFPLF